MTVVDRVAESVPTIAAVEWLSPEPRLWVGSRAGEFAGMIEFTAGHFVATDHVGESLGSYPTLDLAKQRVSAPARILRPVLAQAAVVSGVVASVVALMSLSLVHL